MMREQLPQGLENLIQSIGDMPIPENGEADISIKIRGNDVMERPMFAAGGGANKFPDLSGDGQVTQKDILMGRGVIQKQAGGPIPDMPMPDMPMPDMPMQAPVEPPPEQMMQVQEVEQQADMEGEQVGLDYLARTMDGIDAAEDVEEMINAMRGNDMPIEARRMELAEFVGRDDAMATPETVLAMVQPTIMMSEEGAMNSGIGDLMRQMTQDVDMATEGGAPTDMGEGLGGLMIAGAPMPQEPVQGFAQGGAVKKFYKGGEVAYLSKGSTNTSTSGGNLQGYFDDYLPFFQNIIGDYESDRDKDIGLAIAKGGFQLASGRGSKGENIAGQPFLSQLGAVGTQFAEDIGGIRKDYRKQDMGLRTLAAQSAIKDVQTDKSTTAAMSAANLKYVRDIQLAAIKQNAPVVKVLKDLSGRERLVGYNPKDGTLVTFDTPEQAEGYAAQLGTEADMMTDIGNNLPFFKEGKLSAPNMNAFLTAIDTVYTPKSGIRGGLENKLPMDLAVALVEADKNQSLAGRINQKILIEAQALVANPEQKLLDNLAEDIEKEDKLERELIPIIRKGENVPKSYGALNNWNRGIANLKEYYRDLTGGKADLNSLDNMISTDIHMNHLANTITRLQFEEAGAERLKMVIDLAAEQAKILYATTPPGLTAQEKLLWNRAEDNEVHATAKKLRDEMRNLRRDAEDALASAQPGGDPSGYSDGDLRLAHKLLREQRLTVIETSLDNVIAAFEGEMGYTSRKGGGFKKRSEAQRSLRETGIFKPEDEQLSPALDMLGKPQ